MQRLEYHATSLSCDKYHMDLFTAKESNSKYKVHMVKTHSTVYPLLESITKLL